MSARLTLTIVAAMLLLAGIGKALDRPPQQVVDERSALMKSYVNALIQSGKFVGGKGTAAEALAKVSDARAAAANLPNLFPSGTAPGDTGVASTRALPAVWSSQSDFAAK